MADRSNLRPNGCVTSPKGSAARSSVDGIAAGADSMDGVGSVSVVAAAASAKPSGASLGVAAVGASPVTVGVVSADGLTATGSCVADEDESLVSFEIAAVVSVAADGAVE